MASGAPTLAKLLARADITDHEEVLKAANAALKKSKTDIEAQHVRVVALLKLDRYDDALRALEEGGNAVKSRASIEHVYALYKTGHLEEAAKVAQSGAESGSRGLLHVLAQTAYRLEDFTRAAEIYEELVSKLQGAEHEENDLRINRSASDAQLEWQGNGHLVSKKKPTREDLEGFMTAYNAACGSLARGELAQGDILLRRAKDLCNASDELSDEEKKVEILPILVQQLYIATRLGNFDDAKGLAAEIATGNVSDPATRHIAQINMLAAKEAPENPFLAQRIFTSVPSLPPSDRPFDYQSVILRQDGYVLDLLALKEDGVRKSTAATLSQQTLPSTSPGANTVAVINAAAHAHSTAGKAGIKALLPLLEKRPNDVGLLLTVLQLYVSTNNHGSAISLLEAFLTRLEQSSKPADLDVRYAPGLVGTLIALYSTQSRRSAIRAELARVATYWTDKFKSSSKQDTRSPASALLTAAGSELLTSSSDADRALALSIFQNLHAAAAKDRAALAGLVASDDSGKAVATDDLPSAERLVADIDAAALEEAGVAGVPLQRTKSIKRPADDKSTGRDRKAAESPKKKRKLTAKRTPKDFVEGKQMDPERWLPMKDRSYYRPKGKKKARMAGGGTQGGVSDEKAVAATSGQQTASGGGGAAKKSNKKKGKGKR